MFPVHRVPEQRLFTDLSYWLLSLSGLWTVRLVIPVYMVLYVGAHCWSPQPQNWYRYPSINVWTSICANMQAMGIQKLLQIYLFSYSYWLYTIIIPFISNVNIWICQKDTSTSSDLSRLLCASSSLHEPDGPEGRKNTFKHFFSLSLSIFLFMFP